MRIRTHAFFFILLPVFLFFVASQSLAQIKEISLVITVQDQLDNIIPGAQIALNDSEGKEIRTKTNQQGEAQFTKLKPGEVKITVTSKGFIEYRSDPIVLKFGETAKLNITLEVVPVESKVEVGGSDSIEADDYGMVTVLTKKDIEKLPDDPEEFLKALRRIAGDSITGEDLPINVNGIDGERIPPKQLIEQIRIDRNAFSAKYPGTGGGGIQITASSITRNFRGFVNFNFADSSLNAANPFLGIRQPFQSRNYQFGLSGPIRKKTSFSFSLSRNEHDSGSIINAVILDSNLQPTEFKMSFPAISRNQQFNLTLNSDLLKKHKLYLSYSLSKSRGSGQGIGLFTLPERSSRSTRQGHSLALSDTYLKNPYFVIQTRFSARYDRSNSSGESNLPAINVAESFFGGGSTANSSNENFYLELSSDAIMQRGKRSLEYGFNIKAFRVNQNSRSNFNGTYSFNGRTAPVLDENNNPLVDNAGRIITEQITSLESYRRTLFFHRLEYSAARIRELGGGASQFSISGGEAAITASQFEYSAYVQTSYNVRKNLGVSFGLRYENQNNIKSPLNFSPRFSLIWSPPKKEKETSLRSLPRLSAGVSLNYQRSGIGNILSARQSSGLGRVFYFISMANAFDPALSSAVLDSFPNAPSIDMLGRLSLPQSKRFFDQGLQTPFDITSNITLNKKFPAKVSAVFSATYARGYRRQTTRNINAPLGGTFDYVNPLSAIYPFNNAGSIYQISSKGRSETLIFSANIVLPPLNWRKKPFSMNLRYSFGQRRDDIVFGSGLPFDAYDFTREFAPSVNDGVQTLKGTFSQTLPFRFSIGGNWVIRNGTRFNITTGRDTNGDGVYSERPAFASDPNKTGVVKTKYGLLDPNPAPGDRIIPRNMGRGSGGFSFDMYLSKTFDFNKDEKKAAKRNLKFTIYANNIFNLVNKGNPIGNMSSPKFIRIISSATFDSVDELITISSPRSMNFSINFNF
jgi:hypothetical protein